jgi:hypothetical protein
MLTLQILVNSFQLKYFSNVIVIVRKSVERFFIT